MTNLKHPCLKREGAILHVIHVGSRAIRFKSALWTTGASLGIWLLVVIGLIIRGERDFGQAVPAVLGTLIAAGIVPGAFWVLWLKGQTKRLAIDMRNPNARYLANGIKQIIPRSCLVLRISHVIAGSNVPNYPIEIIDNRSNATLCELMTGSRAEAECTSKHIQAFIQGNMAEGP